MTQVCCWRKLKVRTQAAVLVGHEDGMHVMKNPDDTPTDASSEVSLPNETANETSTDAFSEGSLPGDTLSNEAPDAVPEILSTTSPDEPPDLPSTPSTTSPDEPPDDPLNNLPTCPPPRDMCTGLQNEFKVLDINQDGALQEEECVSVFRQFDVNRDGALIEEEFVATFEYMYGCTPSPGYWETWLLEWDVHKDGDICEIKECGNELAVRFCQMAGHDDEISWEEYRRGAHTTDGCAAPTAAQSKKEKEEHLCRLLQGEFQFLDQSLDGYLQKEEIVAAFRVFDTDSDGKVVKDEFEKTLTELQGGTSPSPEYWDIILVEWDLYKDGFICEIKECGNELLLRFSQLAGHGEEITWEEFVAHRVKECTAPEVAVSTKEKEQHLCGVLQKEFQYLDGNSDGALQKPELVFTFHEFDANCDGQLVQQEFVSGLTLLNNGTAPPPDYWFAWLKEWDLEDDGDICAIEYCGNEFELRFCQLAGHDEEISWEEYIGKRVEDCAQP